MAAENLRGQQPAAASLTSKVTDSRAQVCGVKKEEFWMKDPITGNWIPESQFNQIDVADLREQLLPRKNNDS